MSVLFSPVAGPLRSSLPKRRASFVPARRHLQSQPFALLPSPESRWQTQLNTLGATAGLAPESAGPAFCFDIDGVLKQGEHVLPEAKEALQILRGKNRFGKKFPFICLTNGGGSLESARAIKLTNELGVSIAEHQIVQSHTIFRALSTTYGDKPVLVVGGTHDNCRRVAEAYGFKHAYIPADVIAWNGACWPFHRPTERELSYVKKADFSRISFSAILVFHDSRDWGRDIQLVLDLVKAANGIYGTSKDVTDPSQWTRTAQIPLYFSNPDLLWGNEFPQPRLGQGALQESLVAVWKSWTGLDLHRTTGGKPTKATYDYASNLLFAAIEASSTATPVDLAATKTRTFDGRVYMVGDNTQSDIAGANAFGWESILVRTGVFRGKDEEAEHTPTIVLPNVLEGIKWALKREGYDI